MDQCPDWLCSVLLWLRLHHWIPTASLTPCSLANWLPTVCVYIYIFLSGESGRLPAVRNTSWGNFTSPVPNLCNQAPPLTKDYYWEVMNVVRGFCIAPSSSPPHKSALKPIITRNKKINAFFFVSPDSAGLISVFSAGASWLDCTVHFYSYLCYVDMKIWKHMKEKYKKESDLEENWHLLLYLATTVEVGVCLTK